MSVSLRTQSYQENFQNLNETEECFRNKSVPPNSTNYNIFEEEDKTSLPLKKILEQTTKTISKTKNKISYNEYIIKEIKECIHNYIGSFYSGGIDEGFHVAAAVTSGRKMEEGSIIELLQNNPLAVNFAKQFIAHAKTLNFQEEFGYKEAIKIIEETLWKKRSFIQRKTIQATSFLGKQSSNMILSGACIAAYAFIKYETTKNRSFTAGIDVFP